MFWNGFDFHLGGVAAFDLKGEDKANRPDIDAVPFGEHVGLRQRVAVENGSVATSQVFDNKLLISIVNYDMAARDSPIIQDKIIVSRPTKSDLRLLKGKAFTPFSARFDHQRELGNIIILLQNGPRCLGALRRPWRLASPSFTIVT